MGFSNTKDSLPPVVLNDLFYDFSMEQSLGVYVNMNLLCLCTRPNEVLACLFIYLTFFNKYTNTYM